MVLTYPKCLCPSLATWSTYIAGYVSIMSRVQIRLLSEYCAYAYRIMYFFGCVWLQSYTDAVLGAHVHRQSHKRPFLSVALHIQL